MCSATKPFANPPFLIPNVLQQIFSHSDISPGYLELVYHLVLLKEYCVGNWICFYPQVKRWGIRIYSIGSLKKKLP
jgi:hypothetical protein